MTAFQRIAFSAFLCAIPMPWTPIALGAERSQPTKITLHPQGEPQPALKYRLLPSFAERIDGNAVVYLGMVKSEQNAFFGNQELRDNIERWRQEPLDKLRDQQKIPDVTYYLDQAARCRYADWQLPIGREPYFEMLLPAVQESRQFARILAAHARIEMAHGRLDAAMKDFRNGFSIGRHVAANETLVGGLVGIAICGASVVPQIETFIQQPGAPNLYWALSDLPRPLIDMRQAVDAEMHGVELTFPEVRDLDDIHLTSDEWRDRLLKLLKRVHELADQKDWEPTSAYLDEAIPGLLPQAKQYLAQHGIPPATLEKMPDAQIVLLDLVRRNDEQRQEAAKWFRLPYPIASKELLAVSERLERQWKDRRDAAPLPQLSAQPFYACRRAQVRLDRQIAALRVLEALRIHAAANEGRLPKRLSDVTRVPIPDDPVTEQPFDYELNGETAALSGPELADAPLRYEITMAASFHSPN